MVYEWCLARTLLWVLLCIVRFIAALFAWNRAEHAATMQKVEEHKRLTNIIQEQKEKAEAEKEADAAAADDDTANIPLSPSSSSSV
jgi:uncharacterized membrane protein